MTATGSMFGLAFGDALGKPTEFLGIDEIVARFGPYGPADLPDDGLVTDDTQMALAVAEALVLDRPVETAVMAEWFAPAVIRRFLDWAVSPDNNRAPGMTCLRACASLSEGQPWESATIPGSKGCGANMRATPIGLVQLLGDESRAGAAQLQAAITHGHPTALAAADLTAFATWWLLSGQTSPEYLVTSMRERCLDQRSIYRKAWLGDLWTRGQDESPRAYMNRGWDECLEAVDRLAAALAHPDPEADPCLATGEGWVAEEALVTAVHCLALFPDEPVRALRRAATTSGDSDSIAALTGAFIGAYHGIDAFPAGWRERIEYRDRLELVGDRLD